MVTEKAQAVTSCRSEQSQAAAAAATNTKPASTEPQQQRRPRIEDVIDSPAARGEPFPLMNEVR